MQNTAEQNYPGLVTSYDTRPGNEVGLFYNALEPTLGSSACRLPNWNWYYINTFHWLCSQKQQYILTGNPFVMGKFMLNITMRARNRVAGSIGLVRSHTTLPTAHTMEAFFT